MSAQSSPIKKSVKDSTANSILGDKEAVATTMTEDTVSVVSLPAGPGVPDNTPMHTVAGTTVPDNYHLELKLSQLDFSSTPPTSVAGKDHGTLTSDDPGDTSEQFGEASTWAAYAEEDVENGLKRLVMAAKDENKEKPGKTVQQYYSESLAKLIKAGEVEFLHEYLN